MSFLVGSKTPPTASPMSPPGIPDAQGAGDAQRANAAAAYGRYQTVLTSGMAPAAPATVSKKTLLGGTA